MDSNPNGEFPDDSFNFASADFIDEIDDWIESSTQTQLPNPNHPDDYDNLEETIRIADLTTQPLVWDEEENEDISNSQSQSQSSSSSYSRVIDELATGIEDFTISGPAIKVKERIGSYKIIHNGITVDFPYDPYESQKQMMEKIIDGVLSAQNCLLESPTGTGKTAALLCSLLSLQQTMEDTLINSSVSVSGSGSCTCNFDIYPDAYITPIRSGSGADGIIKLRRCETVCMEEQAEVSFCCNDRSNSNAPSPKRKLATRTQQEDRTIDNLCEQCVQKYVRPNSQCQNDTTTPKMVLTDTLPKIYYATRTHSQIKQVVEQLKQSAYSNVPMTILSGRRQTCINTLEPNDPLGVLPVDEQCITLKKNYYRTKKSEKPLELQTCGYFMEKERLEDELMGFSDGEAWDIEDIVTYGKSHVICPFYGSKALHKSAKIIFCPYNYILYPWIRKSSEIDPENNIIVFDEAHNIEQICRDVGTMSIKETYLDRNIIQAVQDQIENLDVEKRTRDILAKYSGKLSLLANWIKLQGDTIPVPKTKYEKIQSNIEISMDFLQSSFTGISLGPDEINGLRADLEYLKNAEPDELNTTAGTGDKSGAKASMEFISFLNKLSYTLYMLYKNCNNETTEQKKVNDFGAVIVRHLDRANKPTYELRLICLNPAIAFRPLKKARTIIVASGTLSPINSFESELDTSFNQKLSAKHVINSSQIWVGMLSKSGDTNTNLKFNMENQKRNGTLDFIGTKILETCGIVPHGVLVFFPSYGFLITCINRWKSTKLWHQIEQLKEIFMEKSGSSVSEFKTQMDEFRRLVLESPKTGCVLFAVFRGTISEGVDFKDEQARAVITIGIPHLPIGDPEIKLKRRFNDLRKDISPEYLSGSSWYNTQAFRALNQAFGRCLRHSKDWGALVLLDERLIYPANKSQLSSWIQDFIKVYVHPKQMNSSLSNFISYRRRAEANANLEK